MVNLKILKCYKVNVILKILKTNHYYSLKQPLIGNSLGKRIFVIIVKAKCVAKTKQNESKNKQYKSRKRKQKQKQKQTNKQKKPSEIIISDIKRGSMYINVLISLHIT